MLPAYELPSHFRILHDSHNDQFPSFSTRNDGCRQQSTSVVYILSKLVSFPETFHSHYAPRPAHLFPQQRLSNGYTSRLFRTTGFPMRTARSAKIFFFHQPLATRVWWPGSVTRDWRLASACLSLAAHMGNTHM